MKTRLPKTLLVALMAALVGSVSQEAFAKTVTPAFVSNVTTPDSYVELPSQMQDKSNPDRDYNPYVKDGEGTLSIDLSNRDGVLVHAYCPLFVREGIVEISNSKIQGSPKTDGSGSFVQVSGKNAHLILDNTRYVNPYLDSEFGGNYAKGAYLAVGGCDGEGTLTLNNGSRLYASYSLFAGAERDGAFYTTAAISSTTKNELSTERYSDGVYVNKNESVYGAAIINVNSGSSLEVGSAIFLAEATLNISGKDSQVLAGNIYGYSSSNVWLGRYSNSTTNLNISDGGKLIAEGKIRAGVVDTINTEININVSGDSLLHANNYIVLGEGSDDVINSSNISVRLTQKGHMSSDTGIKLGSKPSSGDNHVVTMLIDATSDAKAPIIEVFDKARVDNYGNIIADSFVVTGGEINNGATGVVTADSISMTGGVLNNAGTLNVKELLEVAKAATLNCLAGSTISGVMPTGCTYAFTLSAKNLSVAGTTLAAGTEYSTATPLTLKLAASENLHAGKYMLLDATQGIQTNRAATPAEIESVTGLGAKKEDIVWEDGILYFYLGEQLIVARDPLADAVQAANWGVYKSSQAFSSLLWAPRSNAVVVKNIEKPTADGKGSILTTEVEGRTLAWGSVYSSFSRNSSSGAFAGAEYSIVGGAIGVERQFACGSSIGAAFGYDWGKASPFTTSRVDQESWHAALYGRAAEWKLGQKSSVALDWSAAVGSTTSEHKALGSDWTQENIQLDARATYTYALTERTALSAFVGAQYYAQNDDSTEKVQADSLQNLRLMVGGGISHKLTEKTTLFGEAMLFNDTMRHNPDVTLDGFNYGTGANPGRLGGSVTAGAQYRLTPDWILRGSYSYEGAENNNEHRVNVGAVYSF